MRKLILCVGALFALTAVPAAFADDSSNANSHALKGMQMKAMHPGEKPSDATSTITLPDSASQTGVEHSTFGLGTANSARDNGGVSGQDISEQARQNSAADQARTDHPPHKP